MLVLVTESGPDGTQTVTWDTEVLRTLAPFEDDYSFESDVGDFDCVDFANRLEADNVNGCRDSYGYNLHEEYFAKAKSSEKRYDQEATCYCDD